MIKEPTYTLYVRSTVYQGYCSRCRLFLEMPSAEAEQEALREDRGHLHADLDNGWIHVSCPGREDAPCNDTVTLYRVEPVGEP